MLKGASKRGQQVEGKQRDDDGSTGCCPQVVRGVYPSDPGGDCDRYRDGNHRANLSSHLPGGGSGSDQNCRHKECAETLNRNQDRDRNESHEDQVERGNGDPDRPLGALIEADCQQALVEGPQGGQYGQADRSGDGYISEGDTEQITKQKVLYSRGA